MKSVALFVAHLRATAAGPSEVGGNGALYLETEPVYGIVLSYSLHPFARISILRGAIGR